MRQIIRQDRETTNSIYAFILSEWKTVWTLLYGPIKDDTERTDIRFKLSVSKINRAYNYIGIRLSQRTG